MRAYNDKAICNTYYLIVIVLYIYMAIAYLVNPC